MDKTLHYDVGNFILRYNICDNSGISIEKVTMNK